MCQDVRGTVTNLTKPSHISLFIVSERSETMVPLTEKDFIQIANLSYGDYYLLPKWRMRNVDDSDLHFANACHPGKQGLPPDSLRTAYSPEKPRPFDAALIWPLKGAHFIVIYGKNN